MSERPGDVEAFLRGAAFDPAGSAPYPRARDDARLPRDTWLAARVPAGVRLELVGDAEAVEVAYRAETTETGFRGPGGGLTFQLWRGGELVSEERAEVGEGRVALALHPERGERVGPDEPAAVHLPETMRPTVLSVTPRGGSIEPAPRQPRWVAYGDSLLEGWSTSAPALGWGSLVARERALDLVNMGYAGAARQELASAEHVAALDAAVYSVTHGTNCWAVVPHSTDALRAGLTAFLDVLRQERPDRPVVVSSPVLRPDAENRPNRLGATLADLRAAMEEAVQERIDTGDERMVLVPGGRLVGEDMLADGIHPDDAGHRAMAEAIGPAVAGCARKAEAG